MSALFRWLAASAAIVVLESATRATNRDES